MIWSNIWGDTAKPKRLTIKQKMDANKIQQKEQVKQPTFLNMEKVTIIRFYPNQWYHYYRDL